MTKLQMVRRTLEFLNRTPITGEEAEDMVICRQWLRNVEATANLVARGANVGVGGQAPEAPVSQVADTIEK